MVCYILPLAAGLIMAGRRRLLRRKDKEGFWLNLMFAGASLFGVVDHLWNGELMLIGSNIASDLALGGTITASVFAAWGLLVNKDRITQKLGFLNRKTGIYQQ
jgi:hypothetical protein